MEGKPKSIERKMPESNSGNVVNTVSELAEQASGATSWASRTGRDPRPPFSTPAAPASAPVEETIPMSISHAQMCEKNREHWPDHNFSRSGAEVGPPPAPARAPVETE
jgi:hypothetical protein